MLHTFGRRWHKKLTTFSLQPPINRTHYAPIILIILVYALYDGSWWNLPLFYTKDESYSYDSRNGTMFILRQRKMAKHSFRLYVRFGKSGGIK